MPGIHRVRSPRARLATVLLAVLALAALVVGGVAAATTSTGGAAGTSTATTTTTTTAPTTTTTTTPTPGAAARGRGSTTARTAPVNGAQESATFRLVDDGRSLTVFGTGRGFKPGSVYVSLFYPDGKCSQTEPSAPQTLAGAFQPRGDGTSYLLVRLDGAAYRAVRGHIGSESVREVTSVSAGAPFTAALTARACALVTPGR